MLISQVQRRFGPLFLRTRSPLGTLPRPLRTQVRRLCLLLSTDRKCASLRQRAPAHQPRSIGESSGGNPIECRVCGRYTYLYKWKQLHRLMRLREWPQEELFPRYNVAPTQRAPVVRLNARGERAGVMLEWGLGEFIQAHTPRRETGTTSRIKIVTKSDAKSGELDQLNLCFGSKNADSVEFQDRYFQPLSHPSGG